MKLRANVGDDEPNRIYSFYHCARCLTELDEIRRAGVRESPEEYARLSIGLTDIGIQIWCVRHNMNVAHFEEKK